VPHGLRYARCRLPGAVTWHSWSDCWGFGAVALYGVGLRCGCCSGGVLLVDITVGSQLSCGGGDWCYSGFGVMLFGKSRGNYGNEKKKVHRRNDDNERVV
jgi:hypothetical protein